MRFLFPLFVLAVCFQANAQRALNTWDEHLPYRNSRHLTHSADRVFVATDVSMFFVQKADMYTERISKCTGLSDIGFRAIEYDATHDRVIIAYDNSNIDLWRQHDVVNIPDIKLKNIIGDKTIYNIAAIDGLAYLGMGFGIVVLDPGKREIKDTYYLGPGGLDLKVTGVAKAFGQLYAATADGLYAADANSPALNDFNVWTRLDAVAGLPHSAAQHVHFTGQHLLATYQDSIFAFDGSAWSLVFTDPGFSINRLQRAGNTLYVALHNYNNSDAKIVLLDNAAFNITETHPLSNFIGNPMDVSVDQQGRMWLADFYRGTSYYKDGAWQFVYPHGPPSNKAWRIDVHRGDIYVAPGGLDANQLTYNREGFFIYRNHQWTQFSGIQSDMLKDTLLDVLGVTYNPVNGKSYFGVFGGGGINNTGAHIGGGIIEEHNFEITIYKHGYVMKDPAYNNYPVFDIATDERGNVWATNPTTSRPLVLRTVDGDWTSFVLQNLSTTYGVNKVYPDYFNRVWVQIRNDGLVVYDPGSDLLSAADDKQRRLLASEGQGNLPSNAVLSMAMDHNGEMWIGTDKGIAVMYCAANVMDGCDAQKIIVSGTDSIAGYLLETERINCMAVDPGNRKWIGTDNGVWLLSANGLQEVHHFTIDNSPLFSNSIMDLKVDRTTGLVYLATARGLQTFQSNAIERGEATQRCEAFVYPNPVKHDYAGPVAITNLPYNGTVKITDAAGALVYQATANGGMATWNGLDYNGRRAASGVYYVTAVSQDGASTCRAKLVLMH